LTHEKPLTDIKYNADGDLLFTSAKVKEGSISVWWADSGERIGTYDGHDGAIFSIDVNRLSTRLISGAADQTVRLWDVETGKELFQFPHTTTVRCVAFAQGDQRFLTVTDQIRGFETEISVYKLTEDYRDQGSAKKAVVNIPGNSSYKITKALWGWHNETLITANSDGSIRVFNTERNKTTMNTLQAHKGPIMSIQFDKYKSTFITASKDGSAKLIDAHNLKIIKEYDTGRPLNAASISPLMDHVIVGGGEQADSVTHLSSNTSQFKVRFYHSIFCEELGSILGHFGPVNCLTFSPDGRSFTSGGEDGYAILHFFDESYFNRTDEVSQI
jgi:translation initiation factor 3 subunit I